ncbi:HD family phosphohydrolase, partial [Gemmatimonadota bacterium]
MSWLSRLRLRRAQQALDRERSFLVRRGKRRLAAEEEGSWTVPAVRWGLGIGLLVFATLLFPTRQTFRYNLIEGEVVTESIVSPITFSIYKSETELSEQRDQARLRVPPVLERVGDPELRIAILDSLFEMLGQVRQETASDSLAVARIQQTVPEISEEALLYMLGAEVPGRAADRRRELSRERIDRLHEALEDIVRGHMALGLVESLPSLQEMSTGTVTMAEGGEESIQSIDLLVDVSQVMEEIPGRLQELMQGADDRLIKGGYELAGVALVPNLILNEQRTRLRRTEAADAVPLTKGTVLKDEEIVRAHTRVTRDALEKIGSLEREMAQAEEQRGFLPALRTWLARLLVMALIFGVYTAFLAYRRSDILADNRTLATLVLVIAIELLLAFVVRESGIFSPWLLPVSVATMLLAVLFDSGIGLVTAFIISLSIGAVMGFDFALAIVHLAAGSAGVFAVRRITRRSHFYRALWVIPLVYAVGIASIEILRLTPTRELFTAVGYGVTNGLLSVVVTMGVLPIFESLFRHTTDISLLELSDLNHPLLRQLAMRAPGTYQHSLMMGELGAAAAEAIGANPLLTRVGAYFHDIGKMNKPEYFVENQSDKNPHNRLSPHMSALIVASHVKEGVELAETYRLPEKVTMFIPEHHGTMTMTFFYLKAVEDAEDGQKISEDDFRYPGPKPQTRETGIVMLADAVEAASRVLQDPSPSRIRGLVSELVRRRFEEGELDECTLTVRDLRRIQDTFTNILTSRFHQRIDYPDKEETLRKAAERDTAARRRAIAQSARADSDAGSAASGRSDS